MGNGDWEVFSLAWVLAILKVSLIQSHGTDRRTTLRLSSLEYLKEYLRAGIGKICRLKVDESFQVKRHDHLKPKQVTFVSSFHLAS